MSVMLPLERERSRNKNQEQLAGMCNLLIIEFLFTISMELPLLVHTQEHDPISPIHIHIIVSNLIEIKATTMSHRSKKIRKTENLSK